MQLRGIHYDTGTGTVTGGTTRETLTREQAARQIEVIAEQLHANAIRIAGGDIERLAIAGELAAECGLEVWLSPQLVNGDAASTLRLIGETARAAETLRQRDHSVVLLIGCELSVFLRGVVPGEGVVERLELISDPARLFPAVMAAGVDPQETLAAFFREAVALARTRFSGPLTYASGVWEEVEWELFDIVGIDAYRSAANREAFAQDLRARTRPERPLVVTEFGCATFTTAPDLGGLAWTVVDRSTEPGCLPEGIVRDEATQARELIDLLGVFEAENVHGAFVFTFIAPSYPSSDDPRRDLDTASYSLVRVWPDGRTQPKQAFHAVAAHYARSNH